MVVCGGRGRNSGRMASVPPHTLDQRGLKSETQAADKRDRGKVSRMMSSRESLDMVQPVESVRVYLNNDRYGMVTCMYCGVKQPINMSSYTDNYIGGKSLEFKCISCEKAFNVEFDFRRYQRINVNIPGKILSISERKEISNVIIVSLSISCIGFNHE